MRNAAGWVLRKAFYVHLINNGFGHVPAEMAISAPVEMVVNNDTFGRADNSITALLKGTGESLSVGVN